MELTINANEMLIITTIWVIIIALTYFFIEPTKNKTSAIERLAVSGIAGYFAIGFGLMVAILIVTGEELLK